MGIMKSIAFAAGLAAGMAATAAAVCAMYPDVSRRAMRDCRRLMKNGKRMLKLC